MVLFELFQLAGEVSVLDVVRMATHVAPTAENGALQPTLLGGYCMPAPGKPALTTNGKGAARPKTRMIAFN